MEKLYLLDASGFLYRSYFAIRNMTNSKGESTNALFGFARSILKLIKDFQPTHVAAIFDGPRGAHKRKAIYTEYKAHRAVMPPDLVYQIQWAQQLCDLMGIPYLNIPDVEADDTLGSIALWGAAHSSHVFLCTSDKDLCQLVSDKISILNTHKDNLISGPKEVEETFGVRPDQIIDLLAMMGDTSDNVPGLPGIGPKTAAGWLKEFGSLNHILKHPELVGKKKQELLTQYTDQVLLSKQLVTIDTDVDFPKDDHFFEIKHLNSAPLKEFYSTMNFTSLIRELEQLEQSSGSAFATPAEEVDYTLVDDQESFDKLMHFLSNQKEICFNTVTTNLQPIKAELVGIGFGVEQKKSWYIPVNGKLSLENVLNGIKPLFDNPKIGFFGHDVKYNYQVLSNYGIRPAEICFDTMLASYLLNSHSRRHGLDQLSLDLFGKLKIPISDLIGKGKKIISMSEVPLNVMTNYCCEDVDYTCRLKEMLKKSIEERNLTSLMQKLELPLMRVLAEMERRGIYLDIPFLQHVSTEVKALISELEQEIYALAGEIFNINSPKQMSDILFTKLGIKAPKKTATGLSTNADVLDSLKDNYPIAGKILTYRVLEKLRSTYIDTLPLEVYPKTHRIHCTFNQTVAATGRLSCQDPNLQNIPIRTELGRKIRKAFRPQEENWSFLGADYSQIELRLLAHFSEDPTMISAFKEGKDIHAHTAANMLNIPLEEVSKEQRQSAKAVNFGILYGQQAFGLSQELNIDVKQASEFIKRYFERYHRVQVYLEECKERARVTGRAITHTGRERLIPEIHSKNMQIRSAAERLAVNSPIQGTAADLIKMAMLKIDHELRAQKFKGYMILQIHDELIFEFPDNELEKAASIIREAMEGVLKLNVPLVVDIAIGKNWAAC